MNGNEEIIIDSSMSFSEAIEGTTCPGGNYRWAITCRCPVLFI